MPLGNTPYQTTNVIPEPLTDATGVSKTDPDTQQMAGGVDTVADQQFTGALTMLHADVSKNALSIHQAQPEDASTPGLLVTDGVINFSKTYADKIQFGDNDNPGTFSFGYDGDAAVISDDGRENWGFKASFGALDGTDIVMLELSNTAGPTSIRILDRAGGHEPAIDVGPQKLEVFLATRPGHGTPDIDLDPGGNGYEFNGASINANGGLNCSNDASFTGSIRPPVKAVADLGDPSDAGRMAYAYNARNAGEGVGSGTGSLVVADGTKWKIPGVATAVQA